ncbi:hypothetical protein Afe04nite_03310 [Asanoa ferruginea]|nr:hypothetical protein Afe04nite_03310 [Asanoa ferruginea]
MVAATCVQLLGNPIAGRDVPCGPTARWATRCASFDERIPDRAKPLDTSGVIVAEGHWAFVVYLLLLRSFAEITEDVLRTAKACDRVFDVFL